MAFVLSTRKNSPMQTIEEIRRARLALLESEAGSQTKLADLLGKSPAQLSQWKNASTSSTGRERAMSSDAARSIEAKMGKPRGWMDTDPALIAGAGQERPSLEQALAHIGAALISATDIESRTSACELLITYIRNPAANGDLIPSIVKRLTQAAPVAIDRGRHVPPIIERVLSAEPSTSTDDFTSQAARKETFE